MILRYLKNLLPRPIEQQLKRNLLYGPQDLIDAVLGRREPMVPPRRMIFIGGPEFKKVGDEFFGHFKALGGLRPEHAVLDVGCGIGRMARPLTAYLAPSTRYEGMDIDPIGIEWCQKHITSRYPNFRFQRADIYNKHYNPKGATRPSEYRFPYPDATFDFVFLTSVFTHMFPRDMDHYLEEIARVLKPGGRSLITYFLWNGESGRLVEEGRSVLNFRHEMDGFRTTDCKVPEDAICLDEGYVRELYAKHGLKDPAVYPGSWCGRAQYLSFQDIVVSEK